MTNLDIILRLMDSNQYRKIANNNQINSYQPLEIQISTEQTISDIMCTRLHHGMLQYLAELLIQLDYMTYIPFGKRGTKQLEKYFKENGLKLTPKEYKKMQMLNILKKNNIEVGNNFKNRIDKFCDYLYSTKQDLNEIESVAACVRQISGTIDNLAAEKKIVGLSERDDKLQQILENMWEQVKTQNDAKIDMDDFLPSVDENKPLNLEEKKYFENITRLEITKDKEEESSL